MFNIMDLFERIKLCLYQQLHKDEIIDEITIEEPILTIFINKQTTNFKECVICLEEMTEDQMLTLVRCSHIYHKECLEKWIYKNSICPLCDYLI